MNIEKCLTDKILNIIDPIKVSDTVVYQAEPSLHEWTLEITLTVPLINVNL